MRDAFFGLGLQYDSGQDPRVAINRSGRVLDVHKNEAGLAINNRDEVVVVHESAGVEYRVGRIDEAGKKITFGDSQKVGAGWRPAVALTDAGDVIVTWSSGSSLMQRFGKINAPAGTIDWKTEEKNYDDGMTPSVAATDGMAIEVHRGGLLPSLWYSTSMITDRAVWMTERRAQLGPLTMPQIVFPSSHDSAMYTYGLSALGKTQYLSIFEQLAYGIRYFDLRPENRGDRIIIHHGPIAGPPLSEVLTQIERYCNSGYRELIIIDWSHFDKWDASVYQEFVTRVNMAIGKWLWKAPLQPGKRLADIPFSTLTENGPCVICAVAERWAVDNPQPGFWVFRDLPVDLFLLSWTLTPVTGVWYASKDANRNLGNAIVGIQNPNGHGRIMNCLYVDYVEYARVTDVGIRQNEYLAGKR